VITTTLINYKVNDNKIEGTHKVTNKGSNSDGFTEFDIDVSGGKITYTDNLTTTWVSNRTRVWVEGESTGGLQISDDVITSTGLLMV